MPSARVLRQGRVTIPKEVRDLLGISEGDVVDFEVSGLTVIFRTKVLAEKKGEMGLLANIHRMQEKIEGGDTEEIEKAIREAIRSVRKRKLRNE